MSKPQKKPPGRIFVNTSISVTPDLLLRARHQAKAQKRNLSNYLQVLIERDINGASAA